MTHVITLLLFIITCFVGTMAYLAKGFVKWSKEKIDEHITGENEFRKYVKEEIEKVNNSMDFFLRDLKPILDNVEKIPHIEEKVNSMEMDIKHIKKHVKYEA